MFLVGKPNAPSFMVTGASTGWILVALFFTESLFFVGVCNEFIIFMDKLKENIHKSFTIQRNVFII